VSYDALRRGRVSLPHHAYLITTVTHDRTPWFADFPTARLVVHEMRRFHDDTSLRSLAWVLMPDHLHWLFQLLPPTDLATAVKRFKGRSARRVNRHLLRTGPVWQRAYHDHGVRTDESLREIARYIVANPLRSGLVAHITEYPLWDAVWL